MHYLDARTHGYGAPPVLGQQQQTVTQLNPMSPSRCQAICAQHGLPYKSVTASGQCTCSTQIAPPISLPMPAPSTAPVYQAPALGPPPVLREVDCVGLPMPAGTVSLPSNFMRRVQAALNYCNPSRGLLPLPITGQFDFLTTAAWAAFVQRYGTWDSTTQRYIGSDPGSITCDGLMLLKSTNDQIYASQQSFIGPIDTGTPGRIAADPSSMIVFEERDMLWLVSPDSRPALRQALQNLTHTVTKTGLGGTVFARAQPSSTPVLAGNDALTAIRAKIAAGFACMIATKSDFSTVFIAYTKDPHVIAVSCSTKGALRQAQAGGSMNGFGIDTPVLTQPSGPSLPSLGPLSDPSQAPATPPDPTTGLPTWALYEGEPPPLIDAARALFTVTGGAPSPAPPPAGTTPGGGGPSYTPPPYPTPQPAPAPPPAAAATSPSWVKPVAIVAGLGLVAYFAFGE